MNLREVFLCRDDQMFVKDSEKHVVNSQKHAGETKCLRNTPKNFPGRVKVSRDQQEWVLERRLEPTLSNGDGFRRSLNPERSLSLSKCRVSTSSTTAFRQAQQPRFTNKPRVFIYL